MTARERFPLLAAFADRGASGRDPGLKARRDEARQALDLIDELDFQVEQAYGVGDDESWIRDVEPIPPSTGRPPKRVRVVPQ